MSEPRIVQFELDQMPRPKPAGFGDPMPTVVATFDDGERKELFSFWWQWLRAPHPQKAGPIGIGRFET